MSRNGSFENGVYGRAARTSYSAATIVEPDHSRAEVAVSAYCRELCGPASNRAVIAVLDALEHGPDAITEGELLRTTRSTAAQFAFAGLDGSRGKVTLTSSRACAPTPERLVARVTHRLTPHEHDELTTHLQDCLPCSAIQIKLDRAERGFAVLWSASTAADRLDAIMPAATAAAEVAPAPTRVARRLDAERAAAAARAYCREVCGAAGSERAVAEILDAVQMQAQTVSAEELLRVTRSAAANWASRYISAQIELDNSAAACPGATIALGNLANGELRAAARRQLGAHVQHCLVCSATQVKMARGERAFSMMAGVAPAREVDSWFDVPAQRVRGRVAPEVAPPAPSPRRQRYPAVAATPPAAAAAVAAAAVPFAEPPAPTPPLAGSTPPPVPPVPGIPVQAGRGGRGRKIRVRRIVAAAVVDLAAAGVIAVLVFHHGHSHTPTLSSAATALHTKAAVPGDTRARRPAKAISHTAKAKPAKHHVAIKVHHAAKTKHAAKAKPAHRAAVPKRASTPSRAVSVPAAPRVTVPVTPRKVVSSPAASKPASTPVKPTTPSATPQGSTLPAQSAPTQGIGSSGG